MATGIAQLEAELGNRYSPKTKKEYIKQARHFFQFAGDKSSYNRHEILAYFDKLLKDGKGQATLSMAWYVANKICLAKSIPFPCIKGPKGDKPNVRRKGIHETSVHGERYEVKGPTPDQKQIAALIAWVKENGDARQRAYLALSTIYAMRAIEINIISRREDIDAQKKRVYCNTAKGGQPKWHRIPDEVLDPILGYDYPHFDEWTIWHTFTKMREAAGLAKATALTPHGIRRWLDTYFMHLPGFPSLTWKEFARWRIDPRDMPARYSHPSPEQVDQDTFPHHPLLPLWGNRLPIDPKKRRLVMVEGRTVGELDDNNQFVPY